MCNRYNHLANCFEKAVKFNDQYKNDIEKLYKKLSDLENKLNGKDNIIVDEFKKIVDENGKQSYSNVTKNGTKKPNPVVLVKPKNKELKRPQVKADLKNNINPETHLINGIRNASQEAVLIECENPEAATKIQTEIQQKLGENYEVNIPDIKNPKIKIVNVYDDQNMTHESYIKAIKNQNSELIKENDYMKIIMEHLQCLWGHSNN